MRISDWSSDVCSSDLDEAIRRHGFSLTWMNFIQDMHRKFNLFIVISNNISIYNKNHKVIHNITNNSLIHIKRNIILYESILNLSYYFNIFLTIFSHNYVSMIHINDRQSFLSVQSVSVSVDLGGYRIIK